MLSKSKYLAGLQCAKLLWTYYNAAKQIPAFDDATQAVFDQGHEVGKLAQSLFPDGTEVPWTRDLRQTVQTSLQLIAARRPVYEASLMSGGVYARADILNPVADDQWDIVEVKSSTGVKPVNIHDVAVQRYCYAGAGLRIRRCHVMHINNEYVRHGDLDVAELLIAEDVTDQVEEYSAGIAGRITEMLAVTGAQRCPAVDIGPQCNHPYGCPMQAACWEPVNSQPNNVFTLTHVGAKAWDLLRQGVLCNADIAPDFRLSVKQRIQVDAERRGAHHVSAPDLRRFWDKLVFPIYFLDFESFQTAVPRFDNSKPYQQIPFQFSLHVAHSLGAEPLHYSWLWDGRGDPRLEMLTQLKPRLGDRGSICAYNAAFETGRLRESAQAFPQHADWVQALNSRILDLLQPFKSFAVYYPEQHGSASMKHVLPALTGKTYDGLAIRDGNTASIEFRRVMFTAASSADREAVRRNLEQYCGLDTYGMLEIVRALEALI